MVYTFVKSSGLTIQHFLDLKGTNRNGLYKATYLPRVG